MIDPVDPKLNLNNLRDIFERIQHLEAFIFFGTLLGYTREGKILDHDDDIDIYVNRLQLNALRDALKGTDFELSFMPNKKWYRPWTSFYIAQAKRVQDGVDTYADFYLYNSRPQDHVIEKWNFGGRWKEPGQAIHVPKHLIFPLQTVHLQGVCMKIPARPEDTCAYLYGPSWRTPIAKSEGYVMKIIDHAPKFLTKSQL